ncbi:hypothetical protein ASPZODRAFT_137462, partial [Penicilliopsis zonata CBS 506.65]
MPPKRYDELVCCYISTINYSFNESNLLRLKRKRSNSDRLIWRLKYSIGFDMLADRGMLKFKVLGPENKEIRETSINY